MKTSRRTTLGLLGMSALASAALPGLSFAAAEGDRRLVVIFLRGAVDAMTLAPAYGDPNFFSVRGQLADDRPGSGGPHEMRDLDGFFALNPDLPQLHGLYRAKELLVLQATATAYRERSHFDAQDAMDRGGLDAGVKQGWLNRTIAALPGGMRVGRPELAIGLGPTLPLSMRGPERVTSWSLPAESPTSADTLERLAAIYRADAELGPTFDKAVSAVRMAQGMGGKADPSPFVALASAAATFLKAKDGPRIATIDFGNWDSHADQNQRVTPTEANNYFPGRFPRYYVQLDKGMAALKEGLGEAWADTAVLVFTEFGRTVRINGTLGTDHGTASAALLAGGAVAGGRVLADWRGLAEKDLYEGRDLYPTTDIRALFKGVLREHLALSEAGLEGKVFPEAREVKALEGLIRA